MRNKLLLALFLSIYLPVASAANVSKIVETHIESIRGQLSEANIYSMLVVTKLLKSAGSSYQADWLAPASLARRYPKGDEMRVMVGIYQFDALYAAAFDKRKATQDYLSAQSRLSKRMGLKSRMEMAAVFPSSLNKMLRRPQTMSLDNALEAYANNARKYRLLVSKPLGLSTVESGIYGFVLEGLHILSQTLLLQPDKDSTIKFLETKLENPAFDLDTINLMYSMKHSLNMAIDIYSSIDQAAASQISSLKQDERTQRLAFLQQMDEWVTQLQTQPSNELIEKMSSAVADQRKIFVPTTR